MVWTNLFSGKKKTLSQISNGGGFYYLARFNHPDIRDKEAHRKYSNKTLFID